MKKLLRLSIVFLLMVSIASSCKTGGPCEDPLPIGYSTITLIFKDSSTGKFLYTETSPSYNKDSLKVFTLNNDSVGSYKYVFNYNNPAINNYRLSIYPITNPTTLDGSVDTTICKRFVIQYYHNQRDTINACFKSEYTKCSAQFQSINVYRNNQQIGSANSTTDAEVTILKN